MLRDKYKQIKINLDKTKPQPFLNVMSLQATKIRHSMQEQNRMP